MGMTHMRFADAHVVEEWSMFDQVAVVTQAYHA